MSGAVREVGVPPQESRMRGAKTSQVRRDADIVAEFERGSQWAARAMCAMFAVLAVGAVAFGW